MAISLSILLFVIFTAYVKCDTPANCTYEDVVGVWQFVEGARGHNSDIDCTMFHENIDEMSDNPHKYKIELLFPNVATDEFGNLGQWTLIYNQGFEVMINYRKYFAFSNWTESEHMVRSRCFETKPGWSHDVYIRDWSCFVGKKLTNRKMEKKEKDRTQMTGNVELKFTNNLEFIEKLNLRQDLWQARAYPQFEGMGREEFMRMLGGKKSVIKNRTNTSLITDYHLQLARDLPVQFDWRNKSGMNFISPVRNQGACGSCYAFASMAMLEARYRIMTNNSIRPVFSVQDVVECSDYSQGCDGGFPFLIAGKYGEDFGVVEESCNPYRGPRGKERKCNTKSTCKRFYTTNYEYVGGYYGATNEVLMRRELIENGPIAVGIEVYEDFVNYGSGIYHHVVKVADKWNPFQLTNHAVLIVGYGIDMKSNQPYWIVKNSWGADWGEDGYFRIRRGTDECGVESLAVKATPIPTY